MIVHKMMSVHLSTNLSIFGGTDLGCLNFQPATLGGTIGSLLEQGPFFSCCGLKCERLILMVHIIYTVRVYAEYTP